MSQPLLQQYDNKLHQLLGKIHQRLNIKFPFIQQTRQLSQQQNQLLLNLGNQTLQYKILVAMMAIDTYTEHIGEIFNETDSVLECLAICLNCGVNLKQLIENEDSHEKIFQSFSNLFNGLVNMIQSVSIFNPLSPYLEVYRSVLAKQSQNLTQNVYNSLKIQNKQLRQRLIENDQRIIDLQIKLTKFLQDQQKDQNNNNNKSQPITLQSSLRLIQLRQLLEQKDEQISKMNSQFSFEIQKYNLVYDNVKKQLENYKSYENLDTVKIIQSLQTEIVMLREEKEREIMVNEQLRRRIQLLSTQKQESISYQPIRQPYSPRVRRQRAYMSPNEYFSPRQRDYTYHQNQLNYSQYTHNYPSQRFQSAEYIDTENDPEQILGNNKPYNFNYMTRFQRLRSSEGRRGLVRFNQ